MKSKSAEVKDKLLEYIVHPSSGSLTASERHVSASDKLGKRYRNMAPVFSIDDDLDTPGEDTCTFRTVKSFAITIIGIVSTLRDSEKKCSFVRVCLSVTAIATKRSNQFY